MQNLLSRPMLLKLNRFFHEVFFFTNSHLHVWNLALRLHKAKLKIDLVCITSLSHKGRPKWTPQVCHTLCLFKEQDKIYLFSYDIWSGHPTVFKNRSSDYCCVYTELTHSKMLTNQVKIMQQKGRRLNRAT